MNCISPIKASFDNSGDITYRNRLAEKGLEPFSFPCRKCLPCRLNISREKAIRAVHEAKTYGDRNIFLTLTYNDENLKSPHLQYEDWQRFIDTLRQNVKRKITCPELKKQLYIPYMVTGEYGEKNKRPHWHAILFNYRPNDEVYKYTTDQGEKVYESATIHKLWNKGNIEYGSVTMDSAGYVARYAAKKLVHGKDQEHDFHPIHKTSSRRAIGRSWIEQNATFTFQNGFVVLPNGQTSKIPRYYIDWCKQHQPDLYYYYLTEVLPKIQKKAELRSRKEELAFLSEHLNYKGGMGAYPKTKNKIKETILKQKFKRLQENLKL